MPELPSREHQDELNRFWNAVVAGEGPDDAFALEAEEMQLVRSLQRAGAAAVEDSPPDLAWSRVRARLAAEDGTARPLAQTRLLTIPASVVTPNGHAASVPTPRHAETRHLWSRWLMSSLATAALLVLTVIGSLVATGVLAPGAGLRLPMLPAISGALSVDNGIVTETLLEASAKSLPDGNATAQLGFHVLQPGVSGYWPAVGTRFFTVDQGAVEILVSGAAHVLNAGDQLTLETPEGFTMRNVGDVEARVMEVDALDAEAVTSPTNATHYYSDPTGGRVDWVIVTAATLPDDASHAKVERITVLPDVALDPFAATGLEWIGIAQGRLGVTLEGERLPFRWDSGEERTYGRFQQLPPIRAGTDVTLRNAGADPLVLYRLAIAPSPGAAPESAGLPDIGVETLVDVPVASLPAGHASVSVGVNHLQPGISRTWPETKGSSIFLVDRGAVEIQTAAATHVLRDGEQLVLETTDGFTMRNLGPNEARVTEVHLLDAVSASFGPTDGLPFSDSLSGQMSWPIRAGATLPGGAAQVRLERLTLDAGASLPPTTATGRDWIGIERGRLGISLAGDRLPFRWDAGEERTYGAMQQLPVISPGTRVTLRNAGDAPLVVYRLAITPSPASAAGEQEIAVETLLDAPVASLTTGHATVWVGLHRLQPGAVGRWPGMVGTTVFRVDAGSVEILSDGVRHVLRAGDQRTLPATADFALRNVGSAEARVTEIALLDAVATVSGPNEVIPYADALAGTADWIVQAGATLPGGAGRVTLERLTLAPGATLPPFAATGLAWIGVAEGRLGMTLEGERLPFRWDSGEERAYGAHQQLPLAPAGAQVTLRNPADTPLVLYRLALAT
jgi:uncharacterized cupin superfamily protein